MGEFRLCPNPRVSAASDQASAQAGARWVVHRNIGDRDDGRCRMTWHRRRLYDGWTFAADKVVDHYLRSVPLDDDRIKVGIDRHSDLQLFVKQVGRHWKSPTRR